MADAKDTGEFGGVKLASLRSPKRDTEFRITQIFNWLEIGEKKKTKFKRFVYVFVSLPSIDAKKKMQQIINVIQNYTKLTTNCIQIETSSHTENHSQNYKTFRSVSKGESVNNTK